MSKVVFWILLLFISSSSISQDFSRKDSLRGSLTPLRSCYDVTYYDLFLIIDEKQQKIHRSYNEIYFIAKEDFSSLQLDLFANMNLLSIEFEGQRLNYTRELGAIFIDFPRKIHRNEYLRFKVWYDGYPRKAVNPPWDGGFSWDRDKNNNPWIGVSCQGLGASSWWPCKDHQSDEPDSMSVTISVRHPLKVVSNGNLRSEEFLWNDDMQDSVVQSEWFVSYHINNYGVIINIGDYIHFSDSYVDQEDTLDLSYYVLSYNKNKAELHFKQVIPMLKCFEDLFGRYPFWDDGFALIETPYLGMEHQSGIAYGNDYLPGYHGSLAYSGGLHFDYIIVHETGHEWWGNSITTNDIADMWVHEGFCTYSEALYVECMYGYDQMLDYVNNQKKFIRNDIPVVGCYHVNHPGSTDMYHKGSLMLHTLRTLINDDTLWFDILLDISNRFKYQTIDANEIISYIIDKTGYDLRYFFSQYLTNSDIPEFQYRLVKEGRNTSLIYRWEAIDGFNMPIIVSSGFKDTWIYPNDEWQELSLGKIDPYDFSIREDLFLINIKKFR